MSSRIPEAKGRRRVVAFDVQLMARAGWTRGESYDRNKIRTTQKDVLFSSEENLHSKAETEVIGNNWGTPFPTIRAGGGLENSKTVLYMQVSRISEPHQQTTVEAEKVVSRAKYDYSADLNNLVKEIARAKISKVTRTFLTKWSFFLMTNSGAVTEFGRGSGHYSLKQIRGAVSL